MRINVYQNGSKSSSKRGREIDDHRDHPSKKCHLTPLDTHDMEWLKGEIRGMKRDIGDMKREISRMKESIMGIGDYFKEEVGLVLSEVISVLHEPQNT